MLPTGVFAIADGGYPEVFKPCDGGFELWHYRTDLSSGIHVADEGDGTLSNAATGTGGLQKWILVGNTWQLAYTLKAGLTPIFHNVALIVGSIFVNLQIGSWLR